jgi:hypothetical protein
VAKMLNDLEDSPKAVAAREKEETDAKEKAAAKEKEAKDTDTPEKTANASNASMVAALVTQSSQETPTDKKNLRIKIRQTIPKTERQKDVLHEHQDKARRMLDYEDRIITQKCQRLAWIEGGRGWEKETEKN